MAWNPAPTEVISSWSENGTDVSFPIASVPELTAAEADASTGDSRKVIYALLEQLYSWYNGLATADKPGKLSVGRSTTIITGTDNLRRRYTVDIDIGGTMDVIAES